MIGLPDDWEPLVGDRAWLLIVGGSVAVLIAITALGEWLERRAAPRYRQQLDDWHKADPQIPPAALPPVKPLEAKHEEPQQERVTQFVGRKRKPRS